jgi:predicted dehydrogenase
MEMRDRVVIPAVCDARPEVLEHAAERYGLATHTELSRMLDETVLDALVIATTPASHSVLVSEAASHHVHVFCEKPLALTREEGRLAAREVAESGISFQIGFQRRYDRAYRDAYQKIREGAIGELITFTAVARDAWQPDLEYARPEVSGGLLLDMAAHDFDLARWLMGSEVERVFTEGNNILYPELSTVGDIDNAVVNLQFSSGAVGNVEASRTGTYGYDIRTEIVGTRGALYIGAIEDGALMLAAREGYRRRPISGFEERFLDSYKLELQEFVECLSNGRAPEPGVDDGLRSLEISIAARESLHEKSIVSVHGR